MQRKSPNTFKLAKVPGPWSDKYSSATECNLNRGVRMLALTKVTIAFMNAEQDMVIIPADTIIIVDLHKGIALFREDHFDIGNDEYSILN